MPSKTQPVDTDQFPKTKRWAARIPTDQLAERLASAESRELRSIAAVLREEIARRGA